MSDEKAATDTTDQGDSVWIYNQRTGSGRQVNMKAGDTPPDGWDFTIPTGLHPNEAIIDPEKNKDAVIAELQAENAELRAQLETASSGKKSK